MKPILFGAALILVFGAAYFLLNSILPSPVAFRDVALNGDLAALENLEKNPDYGLTITPPSGKAESVIGYVGAVAVKDTDPATGVSTWNFLGEFRPSRSEIEVVPTQEKLYEGIVTSGLRAGSQFTAFATDLSVDEAAELRVTNDLVLGYRDNSQIPWDRLRRIPIEPNREYWFVDSAVLTTTSYRKFRKLENKNEITGVAFKANGQMYASTEGFLSQRRLSLRIFNLRFLKPAQGGAGQPIGNC